MGYAFKSSLFKAFKMPSASDQLSAIHANCWGDNLLGFLTAKKDLVQLVFEDLNGLLKDAEDGKYGSETFKALAPICLSMSIKSDHEFLKKAYALNNQLFGTFLMRCMRVNNRQNHDRSVLNEFHTLFAALGIKVSGPWDKCMQVQSFGSTSFADGTLLVELP